jgi:glutathione synthase/RimK-type ligase-like ATP-grasp enzyme
VPLLNPVSALLASSDKLTTHAIWAAAGVEQPSTWDLDRLAGWPGAAGAPLVLKPSLCDGARHIALVGSLDEAREQVAAWRDDEARGGERRGAALVQEWVAEPRCVRIFATPQRTSQAYEKARHPARSSRTEPSTRTSTTRPRGWPRWPGGWSRRSAAV